MTKKLVPLLLALMMLFSFAWAEGVTLTDMYGRAVLSVVHDLSLARRYGTHALLMHEGRCVSQGKISRVLTPDHLSAVYGMDAYGWMKELFLQWE